MAFEDILSQILRAVRLTGSVSFCLSPSGDWQASAGPTMQKFGLVAGSAVPFHIIAEGSCWLKCDGQKIRLEEGDIVAFPFATPHQLGQGEGGVNIEPLNELPPPPWTSVPTVQVDGGCNPVRVLCGFLFCSALGFKPMTEHIPVVLHSKAADDASGWMKITIAQIEHEIAHSIDGSPIQERLTETMFLQMLRQEIDISTPVSKGWLAALSDPSLGKCIASIHRDPSFDWTIDELARVCGMSNSALSDRFMKQMDISPVRYVREWRLHQARIALAETQDSIANIGYDAGYGSEAAFNRAFSKTYGTPPATWRQSAQMKRLAAA
ncbi:AraC family transcriptional regulator [uncultured Ruegeria sp.]|uniref:AraC family transcriptional regulator n=1 Tax=uncultured Ruegeria sp. TaxID=259304 RepID=UPI002630FE74|nr:AraC family transcriptional regulator [uncultured Ruegeria sp.]